MAGGCDRGGGRHGRRQGAHSHMRNKVKWPRNTLKTAREDRGDRGGSHRGEKQGRRWLGEGGSRRFRSRRTAGLLRATVAPPKRERGRNWSGERERHAGGSASLKKRPGHWEGALPRCRSWAAVAARPGGSEACGGEDGADKRARAVSGWARVQARGNGWRSCWAGAAAGPSAAAGLARKGERGAGPAVARE